MSGFNIDKEALKKVFQQGVDDVGRKFQMELDRLHRMYAGKPLDEVKLRVREAFRRIDVKASEAEITDYATKISDGTKIQVKVERIR